MGVHFRKPGDDVAAGEVDGAGIRCRLSGDELAVAHDDGHRPVLGAVEHGQHAAVPQHEIVGGDGGGREAGDERRQESAPGRPPLGPRLERSRRVFFEVGIDSVDAVPAIPPAMAPTGGNEQPTEPGCRALDELAVSIDHGGIAWIDYGASGSIESTACEREDCPWPSSS